jgi:hypothetical protein
LYGVGAQPGYVYQPNFGFEQARLQTRVLEVNTSVPLIVLWVLILGYGYGQARQAIISRDPEQQPRALVIGFIVVSALYLYAVGTAFELAENYRYRFLVEPLFMVLTATAATTLVRRVRGLIVARRESTEAAAID